MDAGEAKEIPDYDKPIVLKVSRKVYDAAQQLEKEAQETGVAPAFEIAHRKWTETKDPFWRAVYDFMAEWSMAAPKGSTVEIED